jgi:shikimate kinase
MADQGPRVLIVGGLGAGKTTLGRLLGEALGVPCHSLDGVAFVDDRWTMRALEDRLRMIDGIAEQPAWIAEGGHLFWTDRLMQEADLIIWLDLPLLALLRRRHRQPGRSLGWHLARLRWLLWWYLWPYRDRVNVDAMGRAATAVCLAPYDSKVRRYRSNPDPAEVVRIVSERDPD